MEECERGGRVKREATENERGGGGVKREAATVGRGERKERAR